MGGSGRWYVDACICVGGGEVRVPCGVRGSEGWFLPFLLGWCMRSCIKWVQENKGRGKHVCMQDTHEPQPSGRQEGGWGPGPGMSQAPS